MTQVPSPTQKTVGAYIVTDSELCNGEGGQGEELDTQLSNLVHSAMV